LATGRVNDSFSSLEKADEKIVNTAETEPVFSVTDAADDRERAVIADGLAGYNYDKVGYRDYRPLTVLMADLNTGEVIGGLSGRTSFGLLFVERFFVPETRRGDGLGSRIIALAEEEARRRGCTRAALFTLTFSSAGFLSQAGLRDRTHSWSAPRRARPAC
jgi:GNAT superfamily N-acetyltransferase